MNERIAKAFHTKAFIPYLMCGDPSLEATKRNIRALAQAGADLIELGIPFSDPMAEGPIIQKASARALQQEVGVEAIFEMVKEIRKEIDLPFVFMTYANVVFSYGIDRFAARCQQVGIDGLILPDVPFEEKEEFESICHRYGLDWISLIALTSASRLEKIVPSASGFLYCVSSLGVTGTRAQLSTKIFGLIEQIKKKTDVPCAIGFGISDPQQALLMAEGSDGIIMGSAFVKLCETYGEEASVPLYELAHSVKQALSTFENIE